MKKTFSKMPGSGDPKPGIFFLLDNKADITG